MPLPTAHDTTLADLFRPGSCSFVHCEHDCYATDRPTSRPDRPRPNNPTRLVSADLNSCAGRMPGPQHRSAVF